MIADKECLYWQSPVYISDEEAIACVSGILAGSSAVVGKRIETNTHIKNED